MRRRQSIRRNSGAAHSADRSYARRNARLLNREREELGLARDAGAISDATRAREPRDVLLDGGVSGFRHECRYRRSTTAPPPRAKKSSSDFFFPLVRTKQIGR